MTIIHVKGATEGAQIAKKILEENVDKRTVLFLSGGKTPEFLYRKFAEEKILRPGAVAMIDERFAPSRNADFANEKMIEDTGFLSYLASKIIPFYGILENKTQRQTAIDYDKTVQKLFKKFRKRIAILGIGEDGHTAGLPASKNQKSKIKNQKLVMDLDNFPGEHKKRITLTFRALSKMDLLIVLVFGREKKKALRLMFSKGPIEEIPARFLNTSKISKKTLLITDQKL